jgi:hypothetical protein
MASRPVVGFTIFLKLLNKRNILSVDDPVVGLIGAVLPAYCRNGKALPHLFSDKS